MPAAAPTQLPPSPGRVVGPPLAQTSRPRTTHGAPAAPRRAPHPSSPPLVGSDIGWFVAVNLVVIGALWWRHGGPATLTSPAGWFIGLGQLTALYGTFAVLGLLVLISRVPWIERRYGMDHLIAWHRLTGIAATVLLSGHAVFTTLGYAMQSGTDPASQTLDFVRTWPDVLAAIVGYVLLLAVAFTSARVARRRLAYETWWFIHLYAYLAIALAFAHQLAVGADFVSDWWARAYWVTLHVGVIAVVVGYRFVHPVVRAMHHRLRVTSVVTEAPGVVSVTLRGRHLDHLAAEAGQFFLLRVLRPDRWWKAHPISLSAAPDGRCLRFTIKALGNDSTFWQSIPVGTRIMAEGPYGAFTEAKATQRKVLLIGGGIGITPVRALYEQLDRAPGDVTLLYRARNRTEGVFLDELAAISDAKGYHLRVSYSRPTDRPPLPDDQRINPFTPDALRAAAPDLVISDVFICGSTGLVHAAVRGLRDAGVPESQIHAELFDY